MYEASLDAKYCANFNTVDRFCEPGIGCKKKYAPFYRLKHFDKELQYAHVKKHKHNIAINGNEVRGVPEDMKDFVLFSGSGEHYSGSFEGGASMKL